MFPGVFRCCTYLNRCYYYYLDTQLFAVDGLISTLKIQQPAIDAHWDPIIRALINMNQDKIASNIAKEFCGNHDL